MSWAAVTVGRYWVTPEAQVLEYYDSPDYSYPASVLLSFFSAIDSIGKLPAAGYSPCEQHAGLFTSDRAAKQAAKVFASRSEIYPHRDH